MNPNIPTRESHGFSRVEEVNPHAQVIAVRRPGVNDDQPREFDDRALAVGLEPFGGDEAERHAVARNARDLADSGRYVEDTGVELTPEHVAVQLADAPDGSPAERWNWWLGSLEVAYGGYAEFQIRQLG